MNPATGEILILCTSYELITIPPSMLKDLICQILKNWMETLSFTLREFLGWLLPVRLIKHHC